MPTNYSLPSSGQYSFTDYIGINAQDNPNGLFPSVLMQGGFQQMPTLTDRNEIPVAYTTTSGFGNPAIGQDGWSSGRRRVGMMINVLDAGGSKPKIYTLIPKGYFGNGGNLGVSDWQALTDAAKFELLNPVATYNGGFTPPNNYTQAGGNGSAGDCWVEFSTTTDTISETFQTAVPTGNTGIFLTYTAKETDAIQVFINGHIQLESSYSWIKEGFIVTAGSLELNTQFVWNFEAAGFSLDDTDQINFQYVTIS